VVYDNDSRIVLANPFVHDLYGLEDGSIVGLTSSEFASRIASQFADAEQLAGAVTRIAEQDGSYSEELEIIHPRRRIIQRVVSPVVTRDGTRVGKVAVYHDVTRERAIDRQKDEFLSLASHELKTPLTSIKGFTQVLLGRATKSGTPEREQRALRTIAEQVDRMTRLVGELLDIARIDTRQLSLQLLPLNLRELVARIVEQVQFGTTRHALVLAEGDPVSIVGDADRLEQVVTNLLENAVKYSPDGGWIEVSIEQRADEAHVVIRDNGIGIPQEQIAHLFTRFYRAQNVASTISGLGLGLYISHQIVLRHGGRIDVTSREGLGSAFRVVLPLQGPPSPSSGAAASD
jgi:signal transduction histidine kinase